MHHDIAVYSFIATHLQVGVGAKCTCCWFESDQISFIFVFFVLDCGNESKTRGNKNQPPLKIFQPKETFNNNIYIYNVAICNPANGAGAWT